MTPTMSSTMTPTMNPTMTPTMSSTPTPAKTPTSNDIMVKTSTELQTGFQNMVEGFDSSQHSAGSQSSNIQSDFTYDETQSVSALYGTKHPYNKGKLWCNEQNKNPTNKMNNNKQLRAYDNSVLNHAETNNIIYAKSQQDMDVEKKTQNWKKNQINDDDIKIHSYNQSF
jgi:hypothetical protein